jgi:hypothetical protein
MKNFDSIKMLQHGMYVEIIEKIVNCGKPTIKLSASEFGWLLRYLVP